MNSEFFDPDSVEKPSRYLGGEIGALIKPDQEVSLRTALAFPDVYEIGMSHVGLRILYGLINSRPGFQAERVMAPWPDREARLRSAGLKLTSLETNRPLSDFDVVGFSLQYELTGANILNMLDLGGIPLHASERPEGRPLVIGGGPNAHNPEPLADFFDFFFLGDAEAGFLEVLDLIQAWKKAAGTKRELLEELAGRTGVYVPSFFKPVYGPGGRLVQIEALRPGYEEVRRAVVPDLDQAFFPDQIITPFTKPVHDRAAIEIARGCTRGCRFCQAGYIYRPVRERNPDLILDLAAAQLKSSGQAEASFLSLSAGDYSCLNYLASEFMDRHSPAHVALSLPSLRVKSITSEMMRQIKRVRKTGFTLAPEAGSQRLRDVINKDLTEEDLLTAANEAFRLGWRLIKLYFMIGLPTETEADVLAAAELARRVKSGTRGKINVSFATFVPKPHTPFQWEPMLGPSEMKARIDLLIDALRGPGLKPKWNPAESSLLEGILSRGDRRLGPVIHQVWSQGGRFEAWSDQLRLDLWLEALAEAGLEPEEYLRERDRAEVLPWSRLSSGTPAAHLWAERERALAGRFTPDCRHGECTGCGVCDFEAIRPRLAEEVSPEKKSAPQPESSAPSPPREEEPAVRVRLNYVKEGPAAALSHLETIEVFLRAFRRAGLVFRYSLGFHPQPRLMFASPLPVGLTGRDEYLEAKLLEPAEPEVLTELLQPQLPRGFLIKNAAFVPKEAPRLISVGGRYRFEFENDLFSGENPDPPDGRGVLISKKAKKGWKQIELASILRDFKFLTSREIEFTLLLGPNGTVKPKAAVEALFGPEAGPVRVEKIQTLLRTE